VKLCLLEHLELLLEALSVGLIQMPLAMIWTRMMMDPGRYNSVIACARDIWASEGLGGFYREWPLFVLSILG
jgi:Mitochondrial carrier protein